jgi:hypothetical protein
MHHHNKGGKNNLKGHRAITGKVPMKKPHRSKRLPKRGNRGGGR